MDPLKWHRLSIVEQLGNIGAEIGRTISWQQQPLFGNPVNSFYRGLSYLDLSISDTKNAGPRRLELCRLREALVDWHYGGHLYHTTDDSWNKYFYPYGIAANKQN